MKKWNMDVVFEHQSNYILRFVDEKFAPSSKENPMFTLGLEIVSPESMEVAGEEYNIAGIPIKYYQNVQTLVDGQVDIEKTADNKKRLLALYKACEIPVDEDNFNPENPPMGFKGKAVYAELDNDQKVKRKSPTKEQLAKGIKEGDVMINPITKKELKTNYPKIVQIFGPAPTGASKPY
jgi:hypothetical protein